MSPRRLDVSAIGRARTSNGQTTPFEPDATHLRLTVTVRVASGDCLRSILSEVLSDR